MASPTTVQLSSFSQRTIALFGKRRKSAPDARLALGKPARALLAAVGGTVYRGQHVGASSVTAPEWRQI